MKSKYEFFIYIPSYPLNAVCMVAATVLLQSSGSAQTSKYLFTGSETNITSNPGNYQIIAYGAAGGANNAKASAEAWELKWLRDSTSRM